MKSHMGSTKEHLLNATLVFGGEKQKKCILQRRDVKHINNVKLGIETKIKRIKKKRNKKGGKKRGNKKKKEHKDGVTECNFDLFFDFD